MGITVYDVVKFMMMVIVSSVFILIILLFINRYFELPTYQEQVHSQYNQELNNLKETNCTIYFQNVSDNLVGYYYDSECLSEVN